MANRAISALADDGLGYWRARFLCCGGNCRTIWRFADAGDNGFRHFRKSVSTSGYDDPELKYTQPCPSGYRSSSKPSSLSGICNALGYSEHVWVDDYSAWLQIYRARKIPSPRNAIAGYTITLPRDPLGSGVPRRRKFLSQSQPGYVLIQMTQRPKKRGRKSTGPKPKRRRGSKSSRYDSTATVRCADQPQNNIVLASYSNTRVGGEEGAMQVLLTAVEHAVSSGNDQQLVSARSSTEMVDDTTMNSTPAQSEAVDYSLLYAKEIPSTLVVEERDGEPIERRGELYMRQVSVCGITAWVNLLISMGISTQKLNI
ncbi:hypothetical protein B0J14DRAFT_691262 [Halenospora varia]|nr:hypothetical protein B0J14DRAFT_691262 [Halenospora varia]